ncbi:hypothetical protein N7540_013072 [Penicillium herquei]|nr:hypothetical protein N7540_013072 [Penicillium herquei]
MRFVASLLFSSSLSLALPICGGLSLNSTGISQILSHPRNDVTGFGREYLILSQERVFLQYLDDDPASGFEHSKLSSTEYDQARQEQVFFSSQPNARELVMPIGALKSASLAIQTGQSPSEPSMQPYAKKFSYGIFLGKWLPRKKACLADCCHSAHDTKSGSTSSSIQLSDQSLAYIDPLDFLDVIARNGPGCAGLAIFMLVPIAYFVLEVVELLTKCCVHKRSPEGERVEETVESMKGPTEKESL